MDDGDADDVSSASSGSSPSAGMMLKAKLAPHLLHDHEWEQMASHISSPRRLFEGANQTGSTGLRPVVSAMDAPVDPQYRQSMDAGQQREIMANRTARVGTPNKGGMMSTQIGDGVTANISVPPSPGQPASQAVQPAARPITSGAPPMVAAPARREAANPLTGDQTRSNNLNSGALPGARIPSMLRPASPATPRFTAPGSDFTNPTSKSIYDTHVRRIFGQSSPRRTSLQRAPMMA